MCSPVFDLQQVAHQRVASTALHKVPLCLQELLTGAGTKLPVEVVEEGELGVLLDLVERDCVHHRFYHTAIIGCDHNVVRLDADRDVLQIPDTLK